MAKIIAVANQKGGVGKTTTAINLSASLVLLGQRVLLVDSDPQGNATMGSGINKSDLERTLNDVLLGETPVETALLNTQAGYDVLPGNSDLTVAEVKLLQMPMREMRLRQALSHLRGQYNFIIIDCPPSLNMLTVNALMAADSVLIALQCEYYALEGLTGLVKTIEDLRVSRHPKLSVEGLVRTMYDGRNRLTNEVSDQLTQHFKSQLFQTSIPRNVRLAEAPSYGLPIALYDKKSLGAQAYVLLAKELLARQTGENFSELITTMTEDVV